MKTAAVALLALPLLAQHNVEKERALGRQLASEIRRQSKPLQSQLPDLYVKRVGGALVAHLPERPFEYSFEVVSAADTIEPLGLPGGYVLVPARFLAAARDEREFVGMLAHSIAHIALRHGLRTAKDTTASVPVIFTGGLIPMSQRNAQLLHELEADRFGLELTARAGYDAAAPAFSDEEFRKAKEAAREAVPEPRAPTLRRPR